MLWKYLPFHFYHQYKYAAPMTLLLPYLQTMQWVTCMAGHHAFLTVHVDPQTVITPEASRPYLAGGANVRDAAPTLQSEHF